MNNGTPKNPDNGKKKGMILTGNDNLHPDILKEIEKIKPLNLGDSGIIKGDLLSPESQSELIEKIKNSGPTHSPGREIKN